MTTSGWAAKRPTMVILASCGDAVLENVRAKEEARETVRPKSLNVDDIISDETV